MVSPRPWAVSGGAGEVGRRYRELDRRQGGGVARLTGCTLGQFYHVTYSQGILNWLMIREN
jgi:hypothetical protein